MSSAGQAVGGALGAVAGFMLGGPVFGVTALKGALYGAQIGMMVGGYLDPPKGPTQQAPATSDLTVQTATYGASRPRLYGTIPVYANIFWLENNLLKVEVKKTKQSGGKGSKKTTTVESKVYYGTFAAGLCDCPFAPIVGIRRIWLGGKLWYDAGSTDGDAVRASNAAAANFSLHIGSETQLADDRMQATLGISNTPAYRGFAYLVFKDLPLAPYGNTLMGLQVKVEVVTAGSDEDYANTAQVITDRYWQGCAWNGSVFCAIARNTHTCATSPDGVTWTEHAMPVLSTEWLDIYGHNGLFIALGSYSGVVSSTNGIVWKSQSVAPVSRTNAVAYGQGKYIIATENGPFFQSLDGKVWSSFVNPAEQVGYGGGYHQSKGIAFNGEVWVVVMNVDTTGPGTTYKFFTSETGDPFTWVESYSVDPLGPDSQPGRISAMGARFCVTDVHTVTYTSDDGYNWTQHTGSSLGTYGGNSLSTDGRVFMSIAGSRQSISTDGITWTYKEMPSPVSNSWHGLAWNGAVFAAVRDYPGVGIVRAATIQPYKIATSDVDLADIVSSECLQCGILEASDIDVSSMTSQVRGYLVGHVGSIRTALAPLQAAWPFDVVQHGYTLKFKPRGATSVVTIPENDLDARSDGNASGVAITSVREMDTVLPRRVTLQHFDYAREYDVSTQYAERLNTDSVNILALDLAIVLTSDEAARIVEVLLYLYWMERYSIRFSIPSAKYSNLEPGDGVTVVTTKGTYDLRLTQITYTADGLLECDSKYNRAATYVSNAIGGTPPAVPVFLGLPGDSTMVLLDVPLLDDSTNQAGYIAAMCGYSSAWTAGLILRTDDAGATWTDLQAFVSPGSEIGYAFNAIGAGRTDIFDNANVLQVYFVQGSFSSVTELAVLNGANYFAYGEHGRWEIIAAKTCVLQADGSYLLSDLLRGRKGTEWACGLHAAGDTVVALDYSTVIFVGSSTDAIGLARVYRGVTDGQSLADVPDYNFTYTGVNLECYSPVYLNGSRHPSTNDWTLTWIPRTRVGGEWRDLVDATMVEASESYSIEIYADGTYTTIKRTLTATTKTVQYPSADQVTDFGSNQSTLYLKIYQVSAIVGPGYPLTQSITR